TRPTRISATIAATVLLVAPTACSGNPDPIIEPSPPVASPTPTATPTAPERESAKAFIRRWQAASFDMQNSGETAEYLSLSNGCTSCGSLAEGVAKIHRDGGSIAQAGGSLSEITRVGKVEETLIYEFVLNTDPSAILDADGSIKTRLSGGSARYQVNVSDSSGSWLVHRVSRISS
ncbi:MAG: hypothetical protein WB471_14070, partial [Nocardioides sp.]